MLNHPDENIEYIPSQHLKLQSTYSLPFLLFPYQTPNWSADKHLEAYLVNLLFNEESKHQNKDLK